MGLAQLFPTPAKGQQITVTDLETAESESFTIDLTGSLGLPDWRPVGAYEGGMGLPGAWRAALIKADLMASMPWHAYRDRLGRVEQIDPTPPLLEQPAAHESRADTFTSWWLDYAWHGNAVGIYSARNGDGWPVSVVPVPADAVGVRRVTPYDDFALPVGAIVYDVGGRVFPAADVLHIRGPHRPGELRGMGALENHLHTLDLAHELQRQARSIDHAAVPSGVLKSEDPDMDATDAGELKQAWQQAQRTRTVAVLNADTSYESLAWSPSETQLLEARKYTLHELALIFGVPLTRLGVPVGSTTYTNAEIESLDLLKFHLAGDLARWEQALSMALPRGSYVKANLDAILRADTLTRYQSHKIGIDAGFLTIDEARELEDRPPLTPEQRAQIVAARPALPPATPPAGTPNPNTGGTP